MSLNPDLDRFGGIARLHGLQALRRLANSHFAVIGVGGVGSWAVEALARSGVGELTLIDLDDICISNSNRQLHTLSSTVGQSKVAVLAQRVREINPECNVHAIPEFLSMGNAERLLHGGIGGMIDAVDAPAIKALMIARARSLQIPLVASGSAGGRRDPLQLRCADLGQSGGDPLLAATRRHLRQNHPEVLPVARGNLHFWDVPCVYSIEKAIYPLPDGTCGLRPAAAQAQGLKLDCRAGLGADTAMTGSVGFALAATLLKRLTPSLA